MAEIRILTEIQIETYRNPNERIKQQVITYQYDTLAPRTIWIDAAVLPDVAYELKNPGKPVPADVRAQGDKARRERIEAEIAKISQATKPRTI